MCAVVPHNLGKGGPLARLPLHPSRRWHICGVEPGRAIETVPAFHPGQRRAVGAPSYGGAIGIEPRPAMQPLRRLTTREGDFGSPCTHRHEGRIAAPHGSRSPDPELSRSTGTGPWRTELAGPPPRGRASKLPATPWPTVRRLDAASLAPLDPRAGRVPLFLHPPATCQRQVIFLYMSDRMR